MFQIVPLPNVTSLVLPAAVVIAPVNVELLPVIATVEPFVALNRIPLFPE